MNEEEYQKQKEKIFRNAKKALEIYKKYEKTSKEQSEKDEAKNKQEVKE